MPESQKILIVGGGIAGMGFAIASKKAGHDVTIVDLDKESRAYGAGITIQGPTFRALGQLGLADEVMAAGFACRGSRIRLADGTLIHEVGQEGPEDPGFPQGGGILRPVLHDIMACATRAHGVNIRLGITASQIDDRGEAVDVTFSDGTKSNYRDSYTNKLSKRYRIPPRREQMRIIRTLSVGFSIKKYLKFCLKIIGIFKYYSRNNLCYFTYHFH